MPTSDRLLTLARDVHSGEVLARGGDEEAHSILQRTGFIPVVRVHERCHRLPTGLDTPEEKRLAARAVARLRALAYDVACDEAFETARREPHYLPLGASVAHQADLIRQATSTGDVAYVLVEFTATHDGILAALDEVLAATAEFVQSLGGVTDLATAGRLRYLAEGRLDVIRSDLASVRAELADRHESPPQRSACNADVGPNGQEASAVYGCPPPPRTAITPSPPPAPPAPTGRRR
ncbi:hypothetical protein [Streptomyces sp. MNP-20]|uniref:hypothetical protein n=1 Tax=Streptomyces sp. MNP-20 TaxID=2721165 RepID=UPI001554B20B|nr:hypothetical protein [Streptomyces sp. MNP-20]